jgi:hypothetical protein
MNESQLRRLFTGILSGDGDIGSRMASSSPYATPAYPDRVNKIVNLLKEKIKKGYLRTLSEQQKQEDIDRYVKYCLNRDRL